MQRVDDHATLASAREREEVLAAVPQKPPFRFVNGIIEISETRITASYRFTGAEFFYRGHFPGDPVTPGVILIEAMAQTGLVALGIYLLRRERRDGSMRTLFSECAVEFSRVVLPGEHVIVAAERIYWRRDKLKVQAELRLAGGELAAAGTLAGIGVPS